ncbi:MAG: octanoyltransferase, partial [Anaerolineae bacterium]|nr:octanoyltransferase [Anaerolineae bacterium]
TYAVAAPADHPLLAGGILESYRRLSRGLLAGLSRLGLNVEIEPSDSRSSEEHRNPVCFEAPSAYEIVLNGMKLVGSAQVRRRSGVLQH